MSFLRGVSSDWLERFSHSKETQSRVAAAPHGEEPSEMVWTSWLLCLTQGGVSGMSTGTDPGSARVNA